MVLAGFVVNRCVRPFAKTEVQDVKLELLISPLPTLTVLLLALVLVQVFASFKASRDASAPEAGRTATIYDLIDYYDDEYAQPVQASLIGHTRAVAYQELAALADEPAFEETASLWDAVVDPVLRDLRTEALRYLAATQTRTRG